VGKKKFPAFFAADEAAFEKGFFPVSSVFNP
jgi:hypothetical protein